MNTVEVFNLTKVYEAPRKKGSVTALKDFSLQVSEGSVFGLLGPNGAGKTTLIKVLLGIASPTLGKAKMLGQDVSNYEIKKHVGYLPESHKFPPYMRGEDVLKYVARLSGVPSGGLNKKIDELLELVDMSKWRRTKVKKYSKGMMQRLGLAQALINDPKLIFLDEPTDGVDPIGRKQIRDILLSLKNDGRTIFINSHLLSEVELVSDRVAILNKGTLLREGTVEELTTKKQVYSISIAEEKDEQWLTSALAGFGLGNIMLNSFEVKMENEVELNRLIDELRRNELTIKAVVPVKTSLEDMFISVIKESEKKVS